MCEWQARCHVCGTSWTCESDSNPGASFCEDCRERQIVAPGVLNWKEVHWTTELQEKTNGN